MSARTFRKLPEDVMLALGKIDAITDILATLSNGQAAELADDTVSTLAFIARGLVHEAMYQPAKP